MHPLRLLVLGAKGFNWYYGGAGFNVQQGQAELRSTAINQAALGSLKLKHRDLRQEAHTAGIAQEA